MALKNHPKLPRQYGPHDRPPVFGLTAEALRTLDADRHHREVVLPRFEAAREGVDRSHGTPPVIPRDPVSS